jgi:hypothetical protein
MAKDWRTTHGRTHDPVYAVWRQMVYRCRNPKSKWYPDYGGRGISVCKQWLSFKNFLADMGERPDGMTLERVDNNKGYSPANCRWATRSEQNKNRRLTATVQFYSNGQFVGTFNECARHLQITKQALRWRHRQWGTFEKGVLWQKVQSPRSRIKSNAG